MEKESQKYTCEICNQETSDKKDYLGRLYITCRLHVKGKVKVLTKLKRHQEIKTFKTKQDHETHSSNFLNIISKDDNTDDDSDIVCSTSSLQQKKKEPVLTKKKRRSTYAQFLFLKSVARHQQKKERNKEKTVLHKKVKMKPI